MLVPPKRCYSYTILDVVKSAKAMTFITFLLVTIYWYKGKGKAVPVLN
jgi:hypothetical protein